jgi:hypothetical protein
MERLKKKFRTHLWVNSRLQLPYLLSWVAFAALTCVGVGGLFYVFLMHTHVVFTTTVLKLLPTFPQLAESFLTLFTQLLLQEKFLVTTTYLVVFGITVGGALWASLKLSHRYAGPIVNFRNTLARIQDSRQFQSVKLRTTDALRDVADEFNQAASHILREQDLDRQTLASCYDIATEALQQPEISKHDRDLLRQIQTLTHPHRYI